MIKDEAARDNQQSYSIHGSAQSLGNEGSNLAVVLNIHSKTNENSVDDLLKEMNKILIMNPAPDSVFVII